MESRKENIKMFQELINKLITSVEAALTGGNAKSLEEWLDIDAELSDKYVRFSQEADTYLSLLEDRAIEIAERKEIDNFRSQVVRALGQIQSQCQTQAVIPCYSTLSTVQVSALVDAVTQSVATALAVCYQHQLRNEDSQSTEPDSKGIDHTDSVWKKDVRQEKEARETSRALGKEEAKPINKKQPSTVKSKTKPAHVTANQLVPVSNQKPIVSTIQHGEKETISRPKQWGNPHQCLSRFDKHFAANCTIPKSIKSSNLNLDVTDNRTTTSVIVNVNSSNCLKVLSQIATVIAIDRPISPVRVKNMLDSGVKRSRSRQKLSEEQEQNLVHINKAKWRRSSAPWWGGWGEGSACFVELNAPADDFISLASNRLIKWESNSADELPPLNPNPNISSRNKLKYYLFKCLKEYKSYLQNVNGRVVLIMCHNGPTVWLFQASSKFIDYFISNDCYLEITQESRGDYEQMQSTPIPGQQSPSNEQLSKIEEDLPTQSPVPVSSPGYRRDRRRGNEHGSRTGFFSPLPVCWILNKCGSRRAAPYV